MRRILSVAALALLAIAPAASAQRGAAASSAMPLEFGVDGGLSFGTGGTNNSTEFGLPITNVRVGFHMNPTWSIEPSIALQRVSVTGASGTDYKLGIAALYHLSPSRTANQVYARPFLSYYGSNEKTETAPGTTVSTSTNVTEFGAGVGVKIPWRDRLSWRLEGNVSRFSEQLVTGQTRIGALFGVSYFTR